MRIALIGDYPLDANQIWGGEQAAFTYLVNELCRLDQAEVHIFTLTDALRAGQSRHLDNGATLHTLPPFPRLELYRRFKNYRASFEAVLSQIKPDLVHGQGALHHGYAAIESGYPAVITVHGVQREDSRHQPSAYLRLRKWVVSQVIERHNLRHTRYLIAISPYVTNYFQHLLRPDINIAYIPNAIDSSFFNLYPKTDQSQTILFAGRIIQRKRVFDLVQAFANVLKQQPLAQLRLAGEYTSEPEYVKNIRAFIKANKLEQAVHLLGPLGEEAVRQEFASCSLLTLPSAQETTPMVIAQAMAAAKPVIATPVGGVADMVADGVSGYLHPVGNIATLAEQMTTLLTDDSLRRKMGQAGQQFAIKNYRADNVARRTYEVYSQMLGAWPLDTPISEQV